MAEVWELIKQAVQRFYEVVVAWSGGLELDPRTWDSTTRLVVLGAVFVLVVWLLLRRRGSRSARRSGWPQFLVTNGSIMLLSAGAGSVPAAAVPTHAAAAAPADGGRRKPAAMSAPADSHYQLKMTVNNLNSFPVQLLELAVQTGTGRLPVIADAAAVLPPHGAVDVMVDLFDLPGDRGSVALYLHNGAARPRSLRLTAPLEWEPWHQRYRVKGTSLRVEEGGVPASEHYRRRRLGQLRRQRIGSAVTAARRSVWLKVTGAFQELRARRARAAAAAAAAREARAAAALREAPISVPLAPSRSSGSGAGAAAPYRERVEWPEDGRGQEARPVADSPPMADPRPPAADPRPPGAAEDERPRERPRLDFPDEF